MTSEYGTGYLFLSTQRATLYILGAQVILYLIDGSRYASLHMLEQSIEIVSYLKH